MNESTFKVGDIVEWSSQAGGFKRTKRGEVVEVVPANHYPQTKVKDIGMARDHKSYIVRACATDGSESQKKRFKKYWPRVSHLRSV